MDDKTFDYSLKAVLDNLEPAYDPASWTALQARMDAALVEEHPAAVDAVDKAVFHTLQRLDVPFQTTHWQMLAAKMQIQTSRILRLRLAKLAECTLLLLFFWNFPAFFGPNAAESPKKPVFPADVPIAEAGGTSSNTDLAVASNEAFSDGNSIYKAAISSTLASNPAIPFLGTSDYRNANSILEILTDLAAIGASAKPMIASVDLIPSDVLAGFSVPERQLLMPIVPTKQANRPGPFYLAASANMDQNRVLVHGTRRNSAGYGGAITAGYRTGKWGIEAGLGYVQKTYTPKREVEIYSGNIANGYYGSTLTDVHTDMVTVPVKVTRRIARIGNTTAHATAGLTANFASQKTYDYGTVYYAPDALPPNFLPDPNQSPQLRQSGRGLLEKGKLNDNFYASVDAGIRIEHPIAGKRYTAFIEPAYRQSLSGKGVGPKREPINTFSIQAGVVAFL